MKNLISNFNPDVLSCLANLSSDEVFTPPRLVNDILDMLPPELFTDMNTTFLDPVCKTGVFLREIAKRLDKGLEQKISDRQERINHIHTKQLFGIAITELTALLSRRSLYCSKTANGKYSVCENFKNPQGNIHFERIEHTWEDGHCNFCNVNQDNFERGEELETHAYQFIHTEKPEEIYNMRFDVIIGNPPYQLNDGGFGRSASPIYHKFVQQAKKLNPRFLIMIIPSRWFAGGKGLTDFRFEMLNDDHIRKIVDYEDSRECFPGVDVAGGVCYFLWERETKGLCKIVNVYNGDKSFSLRALNEYKTFIRNNNAVPIIRKVIAYKEKTMSTQVSSRKPFGLSTNVMPLKKGDIKLRWNNGIGYYIREKVQIGHEIIDDWKVITSKVSSEHAGQPDKKGMRKVLSIVEIIPPGTICSETYIIAGNYKDKKIAENLASYLKTKFVRFLVSQLSFSQDITKDRFFFVPILDMNTHWTDELLYKRYALNQEEISFIESKIRPMETNNE